MKKLLAVLLAALMLLACCSAMAEEIDADLIAAAQEEGELVVYGSCEEDYLAAAATHFEELYGIKTQYQRLSTGEVPAKIERRTATPPPTCGSAAPTIPTTTWRPRACWTTATFPPTPFT